MGSQTRLNSFLRYFGICAFIFVLLVLRTFQFDQPPTMTKLVESSKVKDMFKESVAIASINTPIKTNGKKEQSAAPPLNQLLLPLPLLGSAIWVGPHWTNQTTTEQKVYNSFVNKYLTSMPHSGYESRDHVEQGWDAAYVNFFYGKKYIRMVENVIDAVHSFSTHHILVFVSVVPGDQDLIPTTWLERFPRLMVFDMPKSPLHPWFDKLRASLLARVRRGVIVEADTIIAPAANRLFDILAGLPRRSTPIMPMHPDLRPTSMKECPFSKIECPLCCSSTYAYAWPARKRNGQYRHAHLMWNWEARPFLENVLRRCVLDPRNQHCHSDEAALNYAMWTSEEPVYELCLQDPYFNVWDRFYFGNMTEEGRRIKSTYGPRTIAFMFSHGNKNVEKSVAQLGRLKKLFNKSGSKMPWIVENGVPMSGVPMAPHGLFGENCLI